MILRVQRLDLPSKKPKTKRALGVKDLPSQLKQFPRVFGPAYIDFLGKSIDPWSPGDIDDLQVIFNALYPGLDCELSGKDAPSDVVSMRFVFILLL